MSPSSFFVRYVSGAVADVRTRTITLKYIAENFAAMHVHLTPEETRHIRDLVTEASVLGDRWPAEHALGLFADTPALEGWKGLEKKEAIVGTLILGKRET